MYRASSVRPEGLTAVFSYAVIPVVNAGIQDLQRIKILRLLLPREAASVELTPVQHQPRCVRIHCIDSPESRSKRRHFPSSGWLPSGRLSRAKPEKQKQHIRRRRSRACKQSPHAPQ